MVLAIVAVALIEGVLAIAVVLAFWMMLRYSRNLENEHADLLAALRHRDKTVKAHGDELTGQGRDIDKLSAAVNDIIRDVEAMAGRVALLGTATPTFDDAAQIATVHPLTRDPMRMTAYDMPAAIVQGEITVAGLAPREIAR